MINNRHEYFIEWLFYGSILGDLPSSVPNSLCSLILENLVTFFLYCSNREVEMENMISTRSKIKMAKLIQSKIVKVPNSMNMELFEKIYVDKYLITQLCKVVKISIGIRISYL